MQDESGVRMRLKNHLYFHILIHMYVIQYNIESKCAQKVKAAGSVLAVFSP